MGLVVISTKAAYEIELLQENHDRLHPYALSDYREVWHDLSVERAFYVALVDQNIFKMEDGDSSGFERNKKLLLSILQKIDGNEIHVYHHQNGTQIGAENLTELCRQSGKDFYPEFFSHGDSDNANFEVPDFEEILKKIASLKKM